MKNFVILLIVLLIGVTVVGGFYFLGKGTKKGSVVPLNEVTPTPNIQKGTIEGSLSFPSEQIPADMLVCAETLEESLVACTEKHIKDSKYTYREGFQLEVPIGEYYVCAMVPNFGNGYKAYYSEFVTCGLSVDCASHEPIIVEVKSGQTTDGVNPQDWYNQPTPTP